MAERKAPVYIRKQSRDVVTSGKRMFRFKSKNRVQKTILDIRDVFCF